MLLLSTSLSQLKAAFGIGLVIIGAPLLEPFFHLCGYFFSLEITTFHFAEILLYDPLQCITTAQPLSPLEMIVSSSALG